MKALILAAGKGTRMSHLTSVCPKPMLAVAGRPLLEHHIAWLRTIGVREIAINLHHLPAHITDHFGNGADYGVALTYSHEADLMGTAGAAKKLAYFLDEPFLVVYGDVYSNFDLNRLITHHQQEQTDGRAVLTMALYHVPNPTECGLVELDQRGRVQRFVEKPPAAAIFTDLANAGVLVCEPEVLQYVPAETVFDFGRDLLPRLLAAGRPVYGVACWSTEFVVDIGTPAGYGWAQELANAVVA
jgi:mannose-1-phosphate guanylyltransferase